ncbi:hypothetical protein, partial [Salmonella sp. s51228]|uniref:hypothetical protein n=1 Tax=Salmonella sp. s51228 TaxID=3159652 RepID=UPI0039810F02
HRHRIIPKRINVRVEHVKHSKCRDDFLKRVRANAEKLKLSKQNNKMYKMKREPDGPKKAFVFKMKKGTKPEFLQPAAYQLIA